MVIQKQDNFCRSNINFLTWALLAMIFASGEGKIEKNEDPKNGVILSLQAAMEGVQKAQAFALALSDSVTRTHDHTAGQDCLQLFEDTIHRLNASLNSIRSFHLEKQAAMADIHTWISAALTNQYMCLDGLSGINYNRKNNSNTNLSEVGSWISLHVLNLSNLISDSLTLFTNLLANSPAPAGKHSALPYGNQMGFPEWVSRERRRRLLQFSPDVVVAQDGSGDYNTITEALLAYAPPQGKEAYYVIYIKAGQYLENIVIGFHLTNLMLIGDGMNKTLVIGNKSVPRTHTLYSSATFVVWADGFAARDITFANTAGPQGSQAVALLLAGDQAVLYRCGMEGYQDTLFLHTNRQFFRRCRIYGTIDFIFGNSATVIQKSSILVRRPLSGEANTITAQGRTNLNQNTGITIQACTIMADPELVPVQRNFKTYLGRPWKQFSRTVVMQSTLGDLIDPVGWLQWNDTDSFLNTLYYAEFRNNGVGADTSKRVKWPGYRVIFNPDEAERFTVGNFIHGDLWIPRSRVAFNSSLN